ncbi:hypothetical protein [Falsibacillus pallidus]|uniref:hypothetical protein n=1 Tax=Falsibacillus pallidus TaxID=493781 RepID=UPI003D96360E
MKKFWKILLLIVLILALGGGATAYYFLKLKTYDVADKKVEEITESDYDIVLPDDSSSPNTVEQGDKSTDSSATGKPDSDSAGSSNSDNGTAVASNDNDGKASGGTTSASGSTSSSPSTPASGSTSTTTGGTQTNSNEVTVAAIKQKYRPSFESLESQANDKINSLIGRAFDEFKTKRAKGESISFGYFYQKYKGAGDELESKTDSAFNIIYKALQSDLKKNGFSTSHAEDFKKQYEDAKNARRAALLKKAKEAL